MYTTIIHPLRKAYNLSINEYCVLESIRHLADNEKFDFWCVASHQKIADGLDLSRRWVITVFHTLEQKGLIYKRRATKQDTAVRCCQEWKDILTNQTIVLALKNGDASLITSQVVNKLHRGSEQNSLPSEQSSHNINNNINNNIITQDNSNELSKETSSLEIQDNKIEKSQTQLIRKTQEENSPPKVPRKGSALSEPVAEFLGDFRPETFGKQSVAVSGVLVMLAQFCGLAEGFNESKAIQRNMAHQIVRLINTLGAKEIKRRLELIKNHDFHHKKMYQITSLYRMLRSLPPDVEPKDQDMSIAEKKRQRDNRGDTYQNSTFKKPVDWFSLVPVIKNLLLELKDGKPWLRVEIERKIALLPKESQERKQLEDTYKTIY